MAQRAACGAEAANIDSNAARYEAAASRCRASICSGVERSDLSSKNRGGKTKTKKDQHNERMKREIIES